MSLRGPSRCWCCGQSESSSGCVRGHRCNCGLGLGKTGECPACKFCPSHCRCNEAMKQALLAAEVQFHRAMHAIHQAHSERVNRGQGIPNELRRRGE
jgi:hypothetical protein